MTWQIVDLTTEAAIAAVLPLNGIMDQSRGAWRKENVRGKQPAHACVESRYHQISFVTDVWELQTRHGPWPIAADMASDGR